MVKFGVCLPVFRTGSALTESIDFATLEGFALKAEALGYDSLWVADHFMLGAEGGEYEVWTTLSALALRTSRIRLGTLVLCNSHRNPSLVARMAATLDNLSGGRLDLGIGAGWYKVEHEAYGIPWVESARQRVDMLEESINLMKALFTQPRVTFDGKYYTLKDAVSQPTPLQKPWPRIWIGGGGEKRLLRVVAQYADAWNIPAILPEEYAHKLDVIRQHCADVGRNYDEIEKTLETRIMIYEDPRAMEKVVDWFLSFHAILGNPVDKALRENTARDLKRLYMLGTLEEVREKIRRYVDAGVQHFTFYFLDYPSTHTLELVAREVAPQNDN